MLKILTNPEFITAVATMIASIGSLAIIYFTYLKPKHKTVIENAELLINHTIFSELPKYKMMYITNFVCENKSKEEVVRSIVIHTIDAGIKHLKELAEKIDNSCDGDCPCMTPYDMRSVNEECFYNIIHEYNNYFKDGSFSDTEVDLIAHALEKFNKIHDSSVQMVYSAIDMTNKNFQYTSCAKTIQNLIFGTYLASYILTFRDAKETIAAINGFFDDKDFRKREY